MEKMPFSFKVEKDGEEFHAWCPELPGCHTHGKTVNQALENLKDAVQLYLDTVMEEEIARQTAQTLDEA
jgi:predicted RNase H-like HicB family nuclease